MILRQRRSGILPIPSLINLSPYKTPATTFSSIVKVQTSPLLFCLPRRCDDNNSIYLGLMESVSILVVASSYITHTSPCAYLCSAGSGRLISITVFGVILDVERTTTPLVPQNTAGRRTFISSLVDSFWTTLARGTTARYSRTVRTIETFPRRKCNARQGIQKRFSSRCCKLWGAFNVYRVHKPAHQHRGGCTVTLSQSLYFPGVHPRNACGSTGTQTTCEFYREIANLRR